MTKRPFFPKGIEELEALFNPKRDDTGFLQTLIAELSEHSTQRAHDLTGKLIEII
ncbi:hypothetical protein [Pseudochrobactrum kiredjianiae]|uniref:hypothetical protein n=1 Tax=Pseudochrobactrum kiredjianiae TaxID=386305 RepID=UPI0025A2C84B|nr:hypothetical protein [Pseudochrobactrum kiredjianiae]